MSTSVNAKFVVCTRSKSSRVPNKPHVKINGKPIIEHLLDRLVVITTPVYIACPPEDVENFSYLKDIYGRSIQLFASHPDDPLKRMQQCAEENFIDHIIRVTHDKIFIDSSEVYEALDVYFKKGLDYLYSSSMTPGTAFEIMSYNSVKSASEKYENVEHISYAVKSVTENKLDYSFKKNFIDTRLLIDFSEDVSFMQSLFACVGNSCTREQVYDFIKSNSWINNINKLPLVTVYTCSKNNESTILDTFESVYNQTIKNIEYLMVDDCSNDKTSYLMSWKSSLHSFAKYIRNDENIGLASSSNKALSMAKGKYIIRIDADDYFSNKEALMIMINEIEERDCDIIYPGFYDGSMHIVGDPKTNHHPAGALFKTRALNHIKFTDKLRHMDGLDLYIRAKDQLKIGYLKKPLFFYRKNPNSLSRNSAFKEERIEVKKRILNEQV